MRLGLFGGSFDPVHRGHVEPLRVAREALALDRVVCLPTADPPHKAGGCVAPARARLTMAELAWLDDAAVEVSDFEATPGKTTYTIESIEHFAALHPGAELVLLLGGDSLLALPGWRRWRDILEAVEIGVMTRPGTSVQAAGGDEGGEAPSDQLAEPIVAALRDGRIRQVANPPLDISSTRLRRLLAAGEDPPAGWLPELVLKYLRKYPHLYA